MWLDPAFALTALGGVVGEAFFVSLASSARWSNFLFLLTSWSSFAETVDPLDLLESSLARSLDISTLSSSLWFLSYAFSCFNTKISSFWILLFWLIEWQFRDSRCDSWTLDCASSADVASKACLSSVKLANLHNIQLSILHNMKYRAVVVVHSCLHYWLGNNRSWAGTWLLLKAVCIWCQDCGQGRAGDPLKRPVPL